MKFNKKLSLAILCAGTLSFSSCDNLDQLPEATANRNSVFGSNSGLELYTVSFYNMLPTASDAHKGDAMSDYGAVKDINNFLREGAFGPRQSSGWSWSDLRNINYFIANNNHEAVNAETRKHYTALARFFRAYFYYEKVKRFGDVPWINTPMDIADENLYKGRDPRAMVMDSVLADINFACENIRTTNDNSRSLITKSVAYGLKSRICLFEGTFRKYHTNLGLEGTANRWLEEAASAADVVMKSNNFSLNQNGGVERSYRQLFTSTTPVSNEIMLSAVVDPNLAIYNDANWWWTSATYGPRLSLTRTFVNTYLNENGEPFTDNPSYKTMVFADEVKGRDKRLKQTIRMQDYTRTNGGNVEPAPPVFSYTFTGYHPIKWSLEDMSYDGGSRNINSISLMRYAEVLLNYAEAKAELGTLTDEDWSKTIGALRARAGITGGLTAKPTKVDTYLQQTYFPAISDPSILEVRRERGIELVLEGLRFDDLLRWKRGELMTMPWNGFYVPALDIPMDLNEDGIMDVVFYQNTLPATQLPGVTYVNVAPTISAGVNPQQLSNGTSGELTWLHNVNRIWEDRHYLYPIPESDRLINQALGQNPGWEGL